MAPLLKRFLSAAARRGFTRGEHDCMLFAADWVRALTGQDPAAQFRAFYGSETEANAIIAEAGGAEEIIGACLAPLGWARVSGEAQAGDIALVDPPGICEEAAGVCVDSRRVALLSKRGLVVWPMPILAAWRHG